MRKKNMEFRILVDFSCKIRLRGDQKKTHTHTKQEKIESLLNYHCK